MSMASPFADPGVVSKQRGKETEKLADCTADALYRRACESNDAPEVAESCRGNELIGPSRQGRARCGRQERRRRAGQSGARQHDDGEHVESAQALAQVPLGGAKRQGVVHEEAPVEAHRNLSVVLVEGPSFT